MNLYRDNYDYIGVGGLGQETQGSVDFVRESDFQVFVRRSRKPINEIARVCYDLARAYAEISWYSVDSSSWLVGEKYGWSSFRE